MVGSHLDHVVAQIDLKTPDTDIGRVPMLGALLCFMVCFISLIFVADTYTVLANLFWAKIMGSIAIAAFFAVIAYKFLAKRAYRKHEEQLTAARELEEKEFLRKMADAKQAGDFDCWN